MSWRPVGWRNPFAKSEHNDFEDVEEAFEVGADAMLEALRTKGIHRDNEPFDAPRNTGTWVFIPDEEN